MTIRRLRMCLALAAAALVWPAAAHAQAYADSCKVNGKDTWSIESLTRTYVDVDPITGAEIKEDRFFGGGSVVVELHCRDMVFFADLARLSTTGNRLIAEGHVVFIQTGSRLSAEKVDFDLKTQTGTFYNARGTVTIEAGKGEKDLFGGSEPQAMFFGEKIEKVGQRTYRLTNGSFTTCMQPTPRWEMATSVTTLVLDEHVVLHNMVMKVKGVPIFYLPVLYYPINGGGRSTGILMPSYGHSSVFGQSISNAFFWALGRSQDLTLYHDFYSKLGQGFGADYRYVASSVSQGAMSLHVVKTKPLLAADGLTVTAAAHNSYQYKMDLSQGAGPMRIMANVNYFTDLQAVQTQQTNLLDLSQRQRTVSVSTTGNFGALRVGAVASVLDIYYGASVASRTGSRPRITFGLTETPIGRSQVYVGFSTEYNAILRQAQIGVPSTDYGLTRMEFYPTLRAVLTQWPFLSISSGVSWRYTRWDESLNAANVQVKTPLARQLIDVQASITGPSFSRVFDTPGSGYAERFKHVIEPSLRVHRVSAFKDFAKVVFNDGTDTLLGGVTQFDYSLANRLLAKRRVEGGPSAVREILAFTIQQSYYSDARAAQFDYQYQSTVFGTATGGANATKFSPLQMALTSHPTDTTSAAMSIEYDLHLKHMRMLSVSGAVASKTVTITPGWSKRFFIPDTPGFEKAYATQALNFTSAIQTPDHGLGGSWSWSYDFLQKAMLQQRFAFHYAAQCCGLLAEFQTVNLRAVGYSGILSDHRFNISFTLAGLGSFSNQMGAFGDTIR